MRTKFAVTLAVVGLSVLAGCASQRVAGQSGPGTVSDAASSPLYDINVLRTKVPPVLLDAMDAPYVMPNPNTCPQILALIRPLDEALGPDLDAHLAPPDPTLAERRDEVAIDALGSAASSIIPLRGWVRKLSGAERQDRFVADAVDSGRVRRAFLKGIGQQRGCRPPAAPVARALVRQPPGVYPPRSQALDKRGPQYPIR